MTTRSPRLQRDEYVEQAYLYKLLRERTAQQMPMQELLEQLQHEVLITTKLPMAIDFMLAELKHSGLMSPAMRKLSHYFSPFQTFIVESAENEVGRFAMRQALHILEADVTYRLGDCTKAGVFFFQFETICRNRLNYDRGLTAISGDPLYDDVWTRWILMARAQIGLVDTADLIFLTSEEYRDRLDDSGIPSDAKGPFLFGTREGRIAMANRRKDPLFLFAALQRHLGYPVVPRPPKSNEDRELVPQLCRRIERLESRIKLMEQEQKAGLDLAQFYTKPKQNAGDEPQAPNST